MYECYSYSTAVLRTRQNIRLPDARYDLSATTVRTARKKRWHMVDWHKNPPPCFLVEYRKKPDTYVSDSWETQDRRSMNHSTLCISVMLTPVLPSALKVKENASCTVRYQITAVKPVCRFLPRPRVHNPHKHHPRHVRCTSCRPYRVLVLRCSYLNYRLCLLLWHGLLP